MNKFDMPQLAKELNALAEVYERRPITPSALEIWFSALREFPYERVSGALITWPKLRAKMPTPSEMWQTVNERAIDDREQEQKVERARIAHETQSMFAGPTPQAERVIAGIRRILKTPRRSALEHWQHVRDTYERESIGYRYAEAAMTARRTRVERVPGEDDE